MKKEIAPNIKDFWKNGEDFEPYVLMFALKPCLTSCSLYQTTLWNVVIDKSRNKRSDICALRMVTKNVMRFYCGYIRWWESLNKDNLEKV